MQWVVDAYLITFAGFLLLGGRVADLFGRRRLFVAGLVLFTLAWVASGLAAEPWQLIAARAVQGFGGALLSPAALSIVITTFDDAAPTLAADIRCWALDKPTSVSEGGGRRHRSVAGVASWPI